MHDQGDDVPPETQSFAPHLRSWLESAHAQGDDVPPETLSIELLDPGTNQTLTSPTSLKEVLARITFSETVNYDTVGASVFAGGGVEKGKLRPAANATTYLVLLDISGMQGGALTVGVAGGAVEDLAGNRSPGLTGATLAADWDPPDPEISAGADPPAALPTVQFQIDFGEAVDAGRLGPDDVAVSDGFASNLRAEPQGQNRTFAFDVTHGLRTGNLTVGVGANATTDAAGNHNGASGPFTVAAGGGPQIERPSAKSLQAGTLAENSTAVGVDAVLIVVNSTDADYFVLYVRHALDGNGTVDIPVSVTLGGNGTTTLAENVAALPPERYRVEKYPVADPADVDGDGIDDIAELADPMGMNPVNPAAAIALGNGSVTVPNLDTFEALSSHFEGRWHIKFVLFGMHTDRPGVYFQNTGTYPHHWQFLDAISLQGIRGTITYAPEIAAPDGSLGVYILQLNTFTSYTYSFSFAARSYTVLAASMPLLDDNLAFHISNDALPYVQSGLPSYGASRINLMFDEDVYPETDFLALNLGEGYGLLQVMEPDERPHPRSVVIYEALPNELPRVAGIISTVPQTPLSHVNLRAVQDGVPNAFIRGALEDTEIDALLGSYVRYAVTGDGWELRAATRAEVDAYYNSSRPAGEQIPQRDLSVTSITPLGEIGFGNWTAFGVKAANVAVLGKMGFQNGTVPDGFAVPFYFYDEFMKYNGLYDNIGEMLADPNFQANFTVQEDKLKELRKAIKDGGAPEWIITELEEMHGGFPNGTSLRYRSSTNNEDLPGFNGAGLYDSKTQHPEETEEDGISKSLKQVYASLWNFRAFVERDFYRIDHTAAAMGVLVHPNYSDELANGVAVSFDPIYGDDATYYINTQLGEDLVTNPDVHSVPEEILLYDHDYLVLSTSNLVPPGQLLMNETQLYQLRDHLAVIHDHFAGLYGPVPDEPFAMEIEFKITGEDVLAIKQARPWVFDSAARAQAGATPPAFGSATYSKGAGVLAITFSGEISGTADLSRLHVRESGQSSGPTVLTGAAQAIAGSTIAITLTGPQREAVNALAAPELDMDAGAVSNGAGGMPAAADLAITVTGSAPDADAGGDLRVPEGSRVTLNGSGSSDPDGDPLTYSWNQTGTPTVQLIGNSTATPTFTAPTVAEPTGLLFTLTVSDGGGGSDTDTVTITVLDNEGNAPRAEAGPDQTVNENAEVTLDGSGSSDPNSDALTYSWSQDSGPSVTLSDAAAESPMFEAPTVTGQTELDFTLTVRDGTDPASDTVTITVRNSINEPPIAKAGTDRSISENTQVMLDGSGSSDPNGDTLTYSWTHNSALAIAITGSDSLSASFTAPNVATDTTFTVTLTVNDGTVDVSDALQVNITDSPNSPPAVEAGADQEVAGGATVTLSGTATDDDPEDALTYSWIHNSALAIAITGSDSLSASFTAPDVAADTTITVTLTVNDGTVGVSDALQVNITDSPNSPPEVEAGADQVVAEGATVTLNGTGSSDPNGDPLTFSWSQDSGPSVTLSSDTAPSPTFTAPAVTEPTDLVFTLTVSDGTARAADTVRITVQNAVKEITSSGGSGGSRGGGGESGGSGGRGGGGGAPPAEIITDVRVYSVSWDCAAGAISATVGPDTDQLTVRMRTSSAGERPVSQADSSPAGARTYTAAMSGADRFVVVEAHLAYEGGRVITEIVNFRGCAGQAVLDRYEPPGQEPAARQPATELEQRQEVCRDGRQPAVRDGLLLLCLFPGTFDVLAERGWSLARP